MQIALKVYGHRLPPSQPLSKSGTQPPQSRFRTHRCQSPLVVAELDCPVAENDSWKFMVRLMVAKTGCNYKWSYNKGPKHNNLGWTVPQLLTVRISSIIATGDVKNSRHHRPLSLMDLPKGHLVAQYRSVQCAGRIPGNFRMWCSMNFRRTTSHITVLIIIFVVFIDCDGIAVEYHGREPSAGGRFSFTFCWSVCVPLGPDHPFQAIQLGYQATPEWTRPWCKLWYLLIDIMGAEWYPPRTVHLGYN